MLRFCSNLSVKPITGSVQSLGWLNWSVPSPSSLSRRLAPTFRPFVRSSSVRRKGAGYVRWHRGALMNRRNLLGLTVVGLIKAVLTPDAAHAAAPAVDQQGQPGTSSGAAGLAQAGAAADAQSLETVVVTATPVAVKKRDASYSIVVADAEEIKESNPKSTADLMRISPGIWPESTGGQTGANIEVAGFPEWRRCSLLHDTDERVAALWHGLTRLL